MVPTTCERAAGSATKGVATSDASAQAYRREEESAVRPVVKARPPFSFIQRSCSAMSARVATAGVL